MSTPGWYPDPSGRPGQLRWWDGRAWTSHLRPAGPAVGGGGVAGGALGVAGAGAGAAGAGPGGAGTPGAGLPGSGDPAAGAAGAPGRPGAGGPAGGAGRGPGGRLLLAVAAVLVALVVVLVVVVQRIGGAVGGPGPDGQSTSDVCVTPDQSPTPPPQDTPGRVTSGRVSVPELGPEWRLQPDTRVPFGRGMMRQQISVDDSPPWIVSLNVGTMVSGDGFFSPEQGVHVVMPCLIGEYYFNEDVERRDVRDEALTVDGHPGWVLETELTFDIEGLDFTSERLVLVIVDLDDGTAGAVVVDLPASAADREPELRAALDDIRIS